LSRAAKLVAAICIAVAVIAGVAVADHARKNGQMHRADVAWWHCEHEGTGCGSDPELAEHKADRIEAGWQRRERAYTAAVAALAVAAAGIGGAGAVRRVRGKTARVGRGASGTNVV
jgi:hypothetical protein